jgi:hypothetical protein
MDLATDYQLGPPSDTLSSGYVAFDADGSGMDLEANVNVYQLTQGIGHQGTIELIEILIEQISGPEKPAKYVMAASKSKNLGKFTIYDVKQMNTDVGGFNIAQIFYINDNGTEDEISTPCTYDETTESISFDASTVKVGLDTGVNIQFAYKIHVAHGITL